MFKIKLIGEIGYNILPFMIQEDLGRANGDDIEVDLSSVGGIIGDGLLISDMFKQYKKDYPDSQMILNIKAEAASMASHIAAIPVFDMVTVEETTLFMIHNPQGAAFGDYNEMKTASNFLERYADVMSIEYARKSGTPIAQIKSDMDKETNFFGQEIIDAGFADELITTGKKMLKDEAVLMMKTNFATVMDKVNKSKPGKGELEKAVAMVSKMETKPQTEQTSTQPVNDGKNNQEDIIMNIDELKEKHPEMHAELIQAGNDQGIQLEKERVKALLEMKKKKDFDGLDSVHERIDEAIENGENVAELNVSLMAILSKNSTMATQDSPIDIDTGGGVDTVSGEVKKDIKQPKAKW